MATATKKKATKKAPPTPFKHDSRICFGIDFYLTEADAAAAFFHGMSCGRDKSFDHVDAATGNKLYAVTVR